MVAIVFNLIKIKFKTLFKPSEHLPGIPVTNVTLYHEEPTTKNILKTCFILRVPAGLNIVTRTIKCTGIR